MRHTWLRTAAQGRSAAAERRCPRPRSGAAAALYWSSHEETSHVQGKRNSSQMVGANRGHQRADRLKPQLQTTSQFDHMDYSLV